MEFLSKDPKETKNFGKTIARWILSGRLKARILALEGELGGGKTTFLQGFACGLKIKERVLSPTFILIQKFKIPNAKFQNFYHLDCYRIENKKEILHLGFKKIIKDPRNLVAIEWADKIQSLLPQDTLYLKFEILNLTHRRILLSFNQELKGCSLGAKMKKKKG